MSFLIRLLLALCAFAGMASGMMHPGAHDSHEGCTETHSHSHSDSHDSDNAGGEKNIPHHHNCCHVPAADFKPEGISLVATFQPILVEIHADVPLIPEEPVYALDKPPLI